MKKFITIFALIVLTACSDNTNQAQYQPQYQQPAPVVVQQAPAQPVVVQQESHEGTAMVAGAALGAVAAMALTDRGHSQAAPVYDNRPAIQQNVTHVTQVNKTVIVNNANSTTINKNTPPTAAASPTPAPTPAPVAPVAPTVNLAKADPVAKPSYATAGTSTPTPTMSTAALTAPKPVTMPAPSPSYSNYKPSNYAAVSYSKPATPAPKPASAPPRLTYSKPLAITYSPSKKK